MLEDFSYNMARGEKIGIVGANGVGKSTFFKCILGFLPFKRGKIEIDGRDVAKMSGKELSRYIAYIPQSSSPVFNHSVLDSVSMGLTNQMGLFSVPGEGQGHEGPGKAWNR